MTRRLTPEILDTLPEDDPRVPGSRRDLRVLNHLMGHQRILANGIAKASHGRPAETLLEIGAGDGSFALGLLQRLQWPGGRITLLDLKSIPSGNTERGFNALGWELCRVNAEALDWLRQCSDHFDICFANLFLHHFTEEQLEVILRNLAERTNRLLACEPRRNGWSYLMAHTIGLIGCNQVTRHDAKVSVQAGFTDDDLTRLWPNQGQWRIEEHAAGLFSHCFSAVRYSEPPE